MRGTKIIAYTPGTLHYVIDGVKFEGFVEVKKRIKKDCDKNIITYTPEFSPHDVYFNGTKY